MAEASSLTSWSERAILRFDQDCLERSVFVDRIIDALVESRTKEAIGVVIGLTGRWGSGKSSVLNLTAQRISERHGNVVLIQFNPWLINARDDLIRAFFSEVHAGLRTRKHLNDVANTIFEYGKRIAPIGDYFFPGVGSVARAVAETVQHGIRTSHALSELRSRLVKALAKNNANIVVLIDELDRIDDADIVTVCQLVRAIADFPTFSYLLAYDEERVVKALGTGDILRGRAYLEKIVQLQIPLPHILPNQLRHLLIDQWDALKAISEPIAEADENRLCRLLDILVPDVLATLRDVKRLIGTFAVLEAMLRFEVNPVDLLGWTAILVKSPETEHAIRRQAPAFIGPESRLFGEELLDAMCNDEAIIDVVFRDNAGVSELIIGSRAGTGYKLAIPSEASFLRIMRFIFADNGDSMDPTRLVHSLPFAKILTLGNLFNSSGNTSVLPHPRHADVIKTLSKQRASSLTEALLQAVKKENLAEYLVAVYGSGYRAYLHPPDAIWNAFSDFSESIPDITKDSVPSREDSNRLIAKFLSGPYLHSFGAYQVFLGAFEHIVQSWIENGRLSLPAHIIELHLSWFDWNRTPSEWKPTHPRFLNEDETRSMCMQLAKECRRKLFEGHLIDQIPDIACLRAVLIGNPEMWDAECHRELLTQLQEGPVLDRFVWYCSHGGEQGWKLMNRLVGYDSTFIKIFDGRCRNLGDVKSQEIRWKYQHLRETLVNLKMV